VADRVVERRGLRGGGLVERREEVGECVVAERRDARGRLVAKRSAQRLKAVGAHGAAIVGRAPARPCPIVCAPASPSATTLTPP